ncbi:hypothetical protein [Bradyrhizobium sp. Arg816]|uniref:hypothetical protein n=1 Tax=Bradyrhizobium sp. Arg816 TaxID=2998491 RepID=UPI00249E9CAF|nr:hypothetical protein [Bradyrhizobium sp. Arg816]MDI3564296.1 hypothetical protein [Bradyrhizobium sp. Arg816]
MADGARPFFRFGVRFAGARERFGGVFETPFLLADTFFALLLVDAFFAIVLTAPSSADAQNLPGPKPGEYDRMIQSLVAL